MRSKNALVTTLQTAIAAAAPDTPLEDVFLFGTPRGSTEVAPKVIRIDITSGTRTQSSDENCKEQRVSFTVQCFVLPAESGDLESEDEAVDASFEIAEAVYAYLNFHPSLGGAVDTVLFPEDQRNFVSGISNFSGQRYGATYLFGIVNP